MKKRPNGYWTKERCIIDALKYNSRREWELNSSAYQVAGRNGWKEECCNHMKSLGSKYKRLIYVFEFSDKFVYVGLTFNPKQREYEHIHTSSSKVYKHIRKTGLEPVFKLITDYLDVEIASLREGEILCEYKNQGWSILNKHNTGGIGRIDKLWTKEKCEKEIKKYDSVYNFRKLCPVGYTIASRNGWLNEIGSHLQYMRYPNGYWSIDRIKLEALKYKTRAEFRINSNVAYCLAVSKKMLELVCNHMQKKYN